MSTLYYYDKDYKMVYVNRRFFGRSNNYWYYQSYYRGYTYNLAYFYKNEFLVKRKDTCEGCPRNINGYCTKHYGYIMTYQEWQDKLKNNELCDHHKEWLGKYKSAHIQCKQDLLDIIDKLKDFTLIDVQDNIIRVHVEVKNNNRPIIITYFEDNSFNMESLERNINHLNAYLDVYVL